MTGLFNQLAKGFRRHMHPGEQLQPGRLPALGAAFEYVNAGVAQLKQTLRGVDRNVAAGLVVDHQAHAGIGRQATDLDFKTAVGQIYPVKQMRFAVLTMLAHVEQGNFLPVEQPGLQLLRGDCLAHGILAVLSCC